MLKAQSCVDILLIRKMMQVYEMKFRELLKVAKEV